MITGDDEVDGEEVEAGVSDDEAVDEDEVPALEDGVGIRAGEVRVRRGTGGGATSAFSDQAVGIPLRVRSLREPWDSLWRRVRSSADEDGLGTGVCFGELGRL